MNLDSYIVLLKHWDDTMTKNNWRKGQALFNALHNLVPEVANSLRGTENDPFHNDAKIPDALAWIYVTLKEWEESK